MAYLLDETDILDGRVKMYRREDSGGVWQYRIWIKDVKRYIRKSTGTKHFSDTKTIAEEAFYNIRAKLQSDLPVISKTFKQIFEIALSDEQRRVERGEILPQRYNTLSRTAHLYYFPFFKNIMVSSITQNVVNDYWRFREDFWRNLDDDQKKKLMNKNNITSYSEFPKGVTLYIEARVLNMVIDKSIELGFMSPFRKPNTTPPAKNETARRPALTMEQWQKMRDFMRDVYPYEQGRHMNDAKRRVRWMLYYYTTTLISSGIRISDARNLKWGDVFLFTDKHSTTSTLMKVHGKNNIRDVIANKELYPVLLEWRNHPMNSRNEVTDYVFSMRKGGPLKDQSDIFKNMKIAAENTDAYKGISEDYMGDTITIYSFRHSYCTFQIQYLGTSYETLSKNLGNSPQMLREHYDHVPTIEMAQQLNQSIHGSIKMGNYNENHLEDTSVEMEQQLAAVMFGAEKDDRQEKLNQLMAGEITKQQYSEWLNTPKSA